MSVAEQLGIGSFALASKTMEAAFGLLHIVQAFLLSRREHQRLAATFAIDNAKLPHRFNDGQQISKLPWSGNMAHRLFEDVLAKVLGSEALHKELEITPGEPQPRGE